MARELVVNVDLYVAMLLACLYGMDACSASQAGERWCLKYTTHRLIT